MEEDEIPISPEIILSANELTDIHDTYGTAFPISGDGISAESLGETNN